MTKNMRWLLITIIILTSCTAGLKYPLVLNEIDETGLADKANALVVFDSTRIVLARTGQYTTYYHKLVKVFNALGRKEYGEASYSYITVHDTVIILEAKVIKPDKKVIRVSKEAITDMPMPAWEGSKFYIPNLRIVKITFPELADSGAVEIRAKAITHTPTFDSTFDYWEMFEQTDPLRQKVLTLSLPASMHLKWLVQSGGLEHTETPVKDRIIHTWQTENVSRVVMEPLMPPLENVATKLLVTCTDTWNDYSRAYFKICEPRLIPDTALIAKVKELIAGCVTRDDTIRALYEFVDKEIRYVETELIGKKGGYEPAAVGFTFKNKYGVCRDKAALLVAMLRTAGIKDVSMVLTNPFILNMDPAMPVASQFNHAIVAIAGSEGWMYLDPTVENSVQYLASIEDEKPVLVCTRQGETIARTPVGSEQANMTVVNVQSELTTAGTLVGIMRIKTAGITDLQIRSMCQMLPKEQLEQMFLGGLRSSYPMAKIDSLKTSDPKDFKVPMEITMFTTIPDYVLKIGTEWHLAPGKSGKGFGGSQGIWNLSERKYPLYLYVKMTNNVLTTMKYPKKLKIKTLPSNYRYEDDCLRASINYQVDEKNHMITDMTELVLKTPYFTPDDYKAAQKCMQQLEEKGNEEIVLIER